MTWDFNPCDARMFHTAWHRRVAEMIPEFGSNGKDAITIEQVMLHTSGFPRAPFNPLDWDGHPLRRDYPIGGEDVQFTDAV